MATNKPLSSCLDNGNGESFFKSGEFTKPSPLAVERRLDEMPSSLVGGRAANL